MKHWDWFIGGFLACAGLVVVFHPLLIVVFMWLHEVI